MEHGSAARSTHEVASSGCSSLAPPCTALTMEAFRTLSVALLALERHRELMQRSSELLRRARTLCAPDAGATSPARAPDRPRPREAARTATRATAPQLACARSGCARPALFRPCFVVGFDGHRATLPNLPVRVCAEHRDHLVSLFRQPRVLDAFRRIIRARGGVEPVGVRVLFQTLN